MPHTRAPLSLRVARRLTKRYPGVVAGGVVGGVVVAFAVSRAARRHRSPAAGTGQPAKRASPVGEPPAARLQGVVLAQLQRAITELEGTDQDAIHEARKAIKRARAGLRLLRAQLGKDSFERENAALRQCALSLAQTRDTQAMLATLNSLLERHPKKLVKAPVLALQAQLYGELASVSSAQQSRPQALAQLRQAHERLRVWRPSEAEPKPIEGEFERIYERARKKLKAARKHPDIGKMHDLRKRVKDLRYSAEMLSAQGALLAGEEHYALRLIENSRRVSDLIGEEHDLALLAERVRAQPKGERKAILRQIDKRQRRLRTRALLRAQRIFRRSPRAAKRALMGGWATR